MYSLQAAITFDADRGARTKANQRDCPILRLPAGIRNKIYKYTFRDTWAFPRPLKPTGQFSFWSDRSARWPCITGLLRTCRQIRHEATRFCHKLVTFDISGYCRLSDAIDDIGTKTCGALAAINMRPASFLLSVKEWRKTSRQDRVTRDRCAALQFYSLQRVSLYKGWNHPLLSESMIREFFKRPELQVKFHSDPYF